MMLPRAPAKIKATALSKTPALFFLALSQSQYPIPHIATSLNNVSINLP